VANAFPGQRISSINSISRCAKATGRNVDEVANATARTAASARIPEIIVASRLCFQKDILNLTYLCESSACPSGAATGRASWHQTTGRSSGLPPYREVALQHRRRQENRGAWACLQEGHDDTRESAAINVCRDLLAEHAKVSVYDPKCRPHEIIADTLGKGVENPRLTVAKDAYEACAGRTPSPS